MNPFELFPQAVRHGRLSPGYLVDAKTGAGPTHDAIAVDVIIDNSYTLSEMTPFGQDGDILIYLKPTVMFHMTPDEIAGGSITVDESPDGLPQDGQAVERYHIMSVAYGRDQDTGYVIDYELTCKPEGAGQPDLLDVSQMGQFAFENGPDYDSRWDQQSDGGWTYDNPSDSEISEYAGRSFGGHMGGTNPDVDSRLLIPEGDYTLIIPVISASGFPVAPAAHSINLSYRMSSDGEKWDHDAYYRAQWWTQPDAGDELRMKVHAEQSGYFGFSLSFDAIPGMTFEFGKPMLLEGTLANAVEGVEHVTWPSKDFYSGDKHASHIDADDPSSLYVGIVPSQYEYGAARSTLSDLQANHRYEIRFETRYAPGSKHVSGDMYVGVNKAGVIMWSAHLDLSEITDEWVEHTVQFGPVDADQATGITQLVTVKHDGQDTATVQLRDFRLIDVTTQGGADDPQAEMYGAIPWRAMGYNADEVLTFHAPTVWSAPEIWITDKTLNLGGMLNPYTIKTVMVRAGHRYKISVDCMTENATGTLGVQPYGNWQYNVDAKPSEGKWTTYSRTFTAPRGQKNLPDGFVSMCVYQRKDTTGMWHLKNFVWQDVTGVEGGEQMTATSRGAQSASTPTLT